MNFLTGISVLFLVCFVNWKNCLVRVKRVIGGQPDNSSDYGFLAALIGTKGYQWDVLQVWGEYRRIQCSGSLINDQWIVTAAHCFTIIKEADDNYTQNDDKDDTLDDNDSNDNNTLITISKGRKKFVMREVIDFDDPTDWKIRLAVKNLKPTVKEKLINVWSNLIDIAETRTFYKVSKIIRHPEYYPLNLEYDIALVKLKERLNLRKIPNICIIPLPEQPNTELWPPTNQVCKVLGWGCKEFEGPLSNEPNSVELPILAPNYCRGIYKSDINLTEVQEFCAGYFEQNVGICSGDSGGPLICRQNDRQVLAGIVSATHINNPDSYPGIFARVTYFRKWIEETIDMN